VTGPDLLSSITDIAPEAWNAGVDALGGTVFHRHEWLRALDAGGLIDADAAHAVLGGREAPTGLAPCLITRHCPKLEMFREYYLRSPLAGRPIAVGHSMYAQSSQVLAATDTDRSRLVDALEERALAGGVAEALMFPLVSAGDPLLSVLYERDYAVGLLSCTNVLPVRWPTFDAYLADLTSARRRNIRGTLRTAEREGLVVTIHRDGSTLDTLAHLVGRTARKHGSPLFFDVRFLRAIVAAMGDRAVTFEVAVGDAVLLSCLALQHKGVLVPWCVGLDYDALNRYDHYNLLYASLVRHAVEEGLREVNFGRSTYRIKRKFGCVQRPVYAAVIGTAAGRADREGWIAAIDERARRELAELKLVVAGDVDPAVGRAIAGVPA
jgi:predicted N-acyltransferase